MERCKHCDIALIYHASEQRLRCHYCDYQTPPPEICPSCGARETALLGVGTQRLEEEVRSHFPDARIARLDRDTAASRGAAEASCAICAPETLDVLVGTQMVAKGHDFPGVRLVGVVAADLGLHLPDFRAAERTFQLLTQVAGRAGRGGSPGRVIVQTFDPDHYAIRPVLDHDYERFYAEEMAPPRRPSATRPSDGWPRSSCPAPRKRRLATRPRSWPVRRGARDGCEVLGPAPAPIARLRGRYRFQLLIKGSDHRAVWKTARRVADASEKLPAAIRVRVDVNPDRHALKPDARVATLEVSHGACAKCSSSPIRVSSA